MIWNSSTIFGTLRLFWDFQIFLYFLSILNVFFQGHPIAVDWAEPEEDVDDDIMKEVKVLYVRNLLIDTTEELLRAHFTKYGKVERVKKIRDYAFIHYLEREGAETAMDHGESQHVDGKIINQNQSLLTRNKSQEN